MSLVTVTVTYPSLEQLYHTIISTESGDAPYSLQQHKRLLLRLRYLIEKQQLPLDEEHAVFGEPFPEILFDGLDEVDEIIMAGVEAIGRELDTTLRHFPEGTFLAFVPVDAKGTAVVILHLLPQGANHAIHS